MRAGLFSGLIGGALLFLTSNSSRAEGFEAGFESRGLTHDVEWEALRGPLKFYVSPGLDLGEKETKAAMLFYYHGTNGRPELEFIRQHIDEDDPWILVGMTFLGSGQFQYSEEARGAEMKIFQEIREELSGFLEGKEIATYVGGFSKGGWVSGLFAESDPTVDGAMILGAGVFDREGETPLAPFKFPKRILIGVGEQDGNLGMSYKALLRFKDLGGEVIFDEWKDLGHEPPNHSETIQQWLAVAVNSKGQLQSKALDWVERSLKEIETGEMPVQRKYIRLKAMSVAPFARFADEEGKRAVRKIVEEVVKDKAVIPEREAERLYLETLAKEAGERSLENLIECRRSYRDISEKYPGTHFGKRSDDALVRTGKLLEGRP